MAFLKLELNVDTTHEDEIFWERMTSSLLGCNGIAGIQIRRLFKIILGNNDKQFVGI